MLIGKGGDEGYPLMASNSESDTRELFVSLAQKVSDTYDRNIDSA